VNPEVPKTMDTVFDKMTQDRQAQRYPDFDAVFEAFYAAGAREYLSRGDLILWSEVQPASATQS
jgi:hypothetical protein